MSIIAQHTNLTGSWGGKSKYSVTQRKSTERRKGATEEMKEEEDNMRKKNRKKKREQEGKDREMR